MSQHARLALTLSERLEQLELDMSAVHDAVARLADRLDLVEQAIRERDQSHVNALSTQVDRVDKMLTFLRDEGSEVANHAPAEGEPTEDSTHVDAGLLG